MRKQHPHISLATVHRTLETLCEIGEARKVTPVPDRARYDGNLMRHHHVVLIWCRRMRDLEIRGIDRLLDCHSALGEFRLLGSSLEIQALCARCGSRAARSKRHTTDSAKDRWLRQQFRQERIRDRQEKKKWQV